MSESGPEVTAAAEKEEEERLHRWIYDVQPYDLEEKFPHSPERSPVRPEIYTERETLAADPAERQRTNVSENTTGMKKNTHFSEKKLWIRPGASISDYFNYGFDEQTWSAYCKKQVELQRFRRNAEIKARRMPVGYGDEEPCCSYSSSGRPSIAASREPNAGIDVSGGRDGCSSTAEGHPSLNDGAKTVQVVTEMSHKEDSTTIFGLTPLPVVNKSLFAFSPPPRFLFKSERPSLSSSAVLGSEHNQDFDGSGFSASSPSVTDMTKGRECYLSHGKCDKEGNRSRAGDRDKECKRHREQQSSSSSRDSNERRKKQRKSTEDGHGHPSTAVAGSMMGKTGTEDTNTSKKKKKAKKRHKKKKKI